MKLINIGFGNLVSQERLDSDHVILSALPPERFSPK